MLARTCSAWFFYLQQCSLLICWLLLLQYSLLLTVDDPFLRLGKTRWMVINNNPVVSKGEREIMGDGFYWSLAEARDFFRWWHQVHVSTFGMVIEFEFEPFSSSGWLKAPRRHDLKTHGCCLKRMDDNLMNIWRGWMMFAAAFTGCDSAGTSLEAVPPPGLWTDPWTLDVVGTMTMQ